MAFNSLEAPQLILIQPFGFAFFMIDFNGPAMAADVANTLGLPLQALGDVKHRVVGQVSPVVVNHQPDFAKVVNPMGLPITVDLFRLPLKLKGDRLENRCLALFDGDEVFLLEPLGEVVQSFPTGPQNQFGLIG